MNMKSVFDGRISCLKGKVKKLMKNANKETKRPTYEYILQRTTLQKEEVTLKFIKIKEQRETLAYCKKAQPSFGTI